MKYIFLLFFPFTLSLFSCRNEKLQLLEHIYIVLQDSVSHYDQLSQRYLEEIAPEERGYAVQLHRGIEVQNHQIDSLIQLISTEAVNLNDRTVSTKYLVKNEAAERIQSSNNELIKALVAEHPNRFPSAASTLLTNMNSRNTLDDRNWTEQRFGNMPMAVSRALLQRFKYYNSKARALILLDLKEPRIGADKEI